MMTIVQYIKNDSILDYTTRFGRMCNTAAKSNPSSNPSSSSTSFLDLTREGAGINCDGAANKPGDVAATDSSRMTKKSRVKVLHPTSDPAARISTDVGTSTGALHQQHKEDILQLMLHK
jgi:hypothetical protein